MLNDKTILITGGTGSFGKSFVRFVFNTMKPKKVIVFSRDEFKQFEMSKMFNENEFEIRFFLGDIRDKERLLRAFEGVDYVVHAAALKQVPALEYNPFEAVKTNIIGAQNIVEAAIEKGVKKVIALSTDKAVAPINLYGATKLVMEKIFIDGNSYAGNKASIFSVVRYGNVVGSRGSVIPYFQECVNRGVYELPVTDERMTRFWITLEQGVNIVYKALVTSVGGEIFIPKMPSMKIVDLVKSISDKCTYRIIGVRPGEKIYETLIHEEEGRNTIDMGEYFVILPQFEFAKNTRKHYKDSKKVANDFVYKSDKNDKWLSESQIKEMLNNLEIEE
jgi:UDP-N-acetylglucosamine 4,6-dehydratase